MKKPKGIYYQKTSGRWQASIQCQNVNVSLGIYDTAEEALKARTTAEQVKTDKGKRCRRWDIREAVNEWRSSIGMKPLRQSAL